MEGKSASFVLKEFKPTSNKVYHLDFHPTQPWIATSDGGDIVTVWDYVNRQVLYDLHAARVDEKRLVDSQLQKVAEGEADAKARATGAEAIRGGGVKDVKFFDEDVHFWSQSLIRSGSQDSPAMAANLPAVTSVPTVLQGKRFLVMCCEYKVIFLDLISMKSLDVTKPQLENRTPLCVDFLPRSIEAEDGPFAAIGGSDGSIRVLSFATWKAVRKYSGGHKGAVHCMLSFMAANGEVVLISGGSDGILVVWPTDTVAKDVSPKVVIPKAHDGGVICIALSHGTGRAPYLVTSGADKSVVVWDSLQYRELRRVKPVSKMVVNALSTWYHPRTPGVEILATVKDSILWGIDIMGTVSGLCNLANQIPPTPQIAAGKKLKMYCMMVHPLMPHIMAFGSNVGVIVLEHAPLAVPPAAALPANTGSSDNMAVFAKDKCLYTLAFHSPVQPLPAPAPAAAAAAAMVPSSSLNSLNGTELGGAVEAAAIQVREALTKVQSTNQAGWAEVAVSKSGKYVSVVWPRSAIYSVFRSHDWSTADSGNARFLAWDICQDRYAVITADPLPEVDKALAPSWNQKSSKKREIAEKEAAMRAAMARAAAEAVSSSVQVKRMTEGGNPVVVCASLPTRQEPVTCLQGGALLGVGYKTGERTAVTSSLTSDGDNLLHTGVSIGEASKTHQAQGNFQLFSWESFQAVSPLLPQPVWSAWDPSVEHCAFAYPSYIVIATLRPQFRYLGNVAVEMATNGVWHRRQLFLATPTTIECVFVDAGVSAVDVQLQKQRAMSREAQAVQENGELAVLDLNVPKPEAAPEKVQLRPPMLQVVRLASFQPSLRAAPAASTAPKVKVEAEEEVSSLLDTPEPKAPEVVVGGGGVSVASTRLPIEQRRPPGQLTVIGVRDGVLWLVDRHMAAHAIGLSHPGIRCRCLAAYGDPVSAVKWASRLGREHHDDMAMFLVGMGYTKEALHLPGLSKRLEYDLCMQCGDLVRAYHCLLELSTSSSVLSASLYTSGGAGDIQYSTPDTASVLALADAHSRTMEQVAGVARYASEYLHLINAADSAGLHDIALQALRRLAGAGTVEGALHPVQTRALTLLLATHRETGRLQIQSGAMVRAGQGREAAIAAALLGDTNLLEKAWQETGMVPEASLHAQSHGRPSLQPLLQQWNRLLLKDQIHRIPTSHTKQKALFEAPMQPDLSSALGKLTMQGNLPVVQVGQPGTFASASNEKLGKEGSLFPLGLLVPGGGVQGLKQPLDLSVLEGGKGPAPQKGPPTIAVPLDFSLFEKVETVYKPPLAPPAAAAAATGEKPRTLLPSRSSANSATVAAQNPIPRQDSRTGGRQLERTHSKSISSDSSSTPASPVTKTKSKGFRFFGR